MYTPSLVGKLQQSLDDLKKNARDKREVAYESPQGAVVSVDGRQILQFAANNYLGQANHPSIIKAAIEALHTYCYGTASVRFICGTQTIHRTLEERLAAFLGVEDVILYSSCFAANEAFFATIVNDPLNDLSPAPDVVYSDELNHASIIDGLRLCKGTRLTKRVYPHRNLAALEALLQQDAGGAFRFRIISTDGVFSMEGSTAQLPTLIELAEHYGTLLFVDDSHAVGVLGTTGRGTPEALGMHGQVDVLSGTLGKALGGAMGGYLAGKRELIEFMRQKSRPYIFSNSVPPVVAATTIAVLDLLEQEPAILTKLKANTAYFRKKIQELGFTIIEGEHAIVPVMVGEAARAQAFSQALLETGVYVVGLWFPVVPEGEARLRVQISAAHERQHLDQALEAFARVGKELGIII